MAYLDSERVRVYPTALRGDGVDPTSSLNTEFNITSIITRLCDKDCFVVDKRTVVIDGVSYEQFVVSLKGYWFELGFTTADLANNLYVGIKILDNGYPNLSNPEFVIPMLSNLEEETVTILDSSSEFRGLAYSTTPFSSSYTSLQLWDGTNQKVPESSWLTIDSTRIGNKQDLSGSTSESIRSRLTTTYLTSTGDVILGGDGNNTLNFGNIAVVHPVVVYINGDEAEADWRVGDGTRKFITGTVNNVSHEITFSGTPQEYRKTNINYDASDVLTLTYTYNDND